jgi:hypothetical protein
MPLKPPFDATDPQSWPQNGEPLCITVHPNTPPQASTGNPTAADGIDDWYVPGSGQSDTSYPDDWFVPSVSSDTNSIQTPPNFQSASVATANGDTSAPPSNNSPAPRPDPLTAYWSLIPASRAGAMAWHPPDLSTSQPIRTGEHPSLGLGNAAPDLSPFTRTISASRARTARRSADSPFARPARRHSKTAQCPDVRSLRASWAP